MMGDVFESVTLTRSTLYYKNDASIKIYESIFFHFSNKIVSLLLFLCKSRRRCRLFLTVCRWFDCHN